MSSEIRLHKRNATLTLAVSLFACIYTILSIDNKGSVTLIIHSACKFEECEVNGEKKCINPADDPDKDCVETREVRCLSLTKQRHISIKILGSTTNLRGHLFPVDGILSLYIALYSILLLNSAYLKRLLL